MGISRKLIGLFLFAILILSFPNQVFGAELGHVFVEQTSRQTITSTTYADIPGAVITDANLTDGKTYLLIFTAIMDNNTVINNFAIKAIHGSTDFEGSNYQKEFNSNTRLHYAWFTVWTAVASEDVKLQFRTVAGTGTSGADQITMVAIKLSDDLSQGTDWDFTENTVDTTLAATYGTGNSASETISSPNGTDDYLVMATATLDPASLTVPQKTRINASGGVTDTGLEILEEGEDANDDRQVQTLIKVYTPSASSTTFTVESESSSASGTRLYNSVFWLNLNKLRNHAQQVTQAEVSLDTTDTFATSTNVATVSLTPDIAGDVWGLGFFIYDTNSAEPIRARMQIDNTDQPDTQTSDNYSILSGWDNTDELLFFMQSMESLSSASHTLDVDATKATTARPVEDRLALMITMEKPAAVDCPSCNTGLFQNNGWIFALGGMFNYIGSWLFPENANAQVQEQTIMKFKIIPQFTTTRSETQVRNFFNNQVIPKLEMAINNRLQSEFSNPNVAIFLEYTKQGNNYEVYPKIIVSGLTQSSLDSLKQKYDLAVDDVTLSLLTDLNNLGINNVKWHIHKTFGSMNV